MVATRNKIAFLRGSMVIETICTDSGLWRTRADSGMKREAESHLGASVPTSRKNFWRGRRMGIGSSPRIAKQENC
jgi:hypothetical protein